MSSFLNDFVLCVHCHERKSQHIPPEMKCLFEPTNYSQGSEWNQFIQENTERLRESLPASLMAPSKQRSTS